MGGGAEIPLGVAPLPPPPLAAALFQSI